jgi:RND family efflux transporter MFP subunit
MRVEEGQVMARLDDTEARAQLDLSQSQLASTTAQLGEIKSQLAQAERDLQRQQDMDSRKLTSQAVLETAATQVQMLRARLNSAERLVQVSERALHVAAVQLDNTTVRAPFAGVVIAKAAQPGEMISPLSAGGGFTRTGVGTIVDMDSLEVEVDVNESYINRVQPGQPAEAVLNAYADWKIPASVIAIIPTADRAKATVKVRIALKLKDPRIVPDMGVRVAFLEERRPEVAGAPPAPRGVLIPTGAVRNEGDKTFAFIVRDGKATRRALTVGGNVGDQRQILNGVAAGETVIVEPPADLKEGQAVGDKAKG